MYVTFNPNQFVRGRKGPPWYILFHNFLETYPNFMKFGNFS